MTDLGVITRGHVLAATAECDRLGNGRVPQPVRLRARPASTCSSSTTATTTRRRSSAWPTGTPRAARWSPAEFSGGRSGPPRSSRDLGFDVSGPDESGHTAPTTASRGRTRRTSEIEEARPPGRSRPATRCRRGPQLPRGHHLQGARGTGPGAHQDPHDPAHPALDRRRPDPGRRRLRRPGASRTCRRCASTPRGSVGDGYARRRSRRRRARSPRTATGTRPRSGSSCYRLPQGRRAPGGRRHARRSPLAWPLQGAGPEGAARPMPVNTCPMCFMAIPATGVCDNCG